MGRVIGGFEYRSGPFETYLSTISSTATFRRNNPLTLSDDRTLIEAASDTTAFVGIALSNAADSLGGSLSGRALVLKLLPGQVFETTVQTGVASSALSAGQSYNLEKSGNFLRIDPDSQASPRVTIVPYADGSTVDSANSSVQVSFLLDFVAPFVSTASIGIFAQD